MTNEMSERVDVLEKHVLGLDNDRPGILLRLDRLEWFVKGLIALAGIGLAWKIVDTFGQFIASRALRQ